MHKVSSVVRMILRENVLKRILNIANVDSQLVRFQTLNWSLEHVSEDLPHIFRGLLRIIIVVFIRSLIKLQNIKLSDTVDCHEALQYSLNEVILASVHHRLDACILSEIAQQTNWILFQLVHDLLSIFAITI